MPDDARFERYVGRPITRRTLLKSGCATLALTPLSACLERASGTGPGRLAWPRYVVRREVDELYLEVTAVGYRERRRLSGRHLEPIGGETPLLVFRLAPQHFAETAIPVTRIPAVLEEVTLAGIVLLPSEPTTLVFRPPAGRRIDLTLDGLLAWDRFELVLPDLNGVADPYRLGVPTTQVPAYTRIEIPWGIELTPALDSASLRWDHVRERVDGREWFELWSARLRHAAGEDAPIPFEVLSVRGFDLVSQTGSAEAGNLVVSYRNKPGTIIPEQPGKPTPLNSRDRIEIATSLSRRFPYTGRPVAPQRETGLLSYDNSCIAACYADGRTAGVEEFRLSARGGSLALDSTWKAFPGCALTGWTHTATLGRDQHVKLVRAGFLYPFGTEAELIVISERAFIKDRQGHFVAVLIKQAYLQVPQPNEVPIDHVETMFKSVSVTTRRTPPLDLPPDGDPGTYARYDFFLPTVDGKPFEFEHVGRDWSGEAHASRMPMFFVSNKARTANGLIREPDSQWTYTQQAGICSAEATLPSDPEHEIRPGQDGLWRVDQAWHAQPYRFAPYGRALIALAQPLASGDTSQRVEWAEWVRGAVPPVGPLGVAIRPFQPRIRTLRIRVQGTSQFAGDATACLATYRDTRFTPVAFLDPRPNATPVVYGRNLPRDGADPDADYLYLLETRQLKDVPPRPPALPVAQAAAVVRHLYYRTQRPERFPEALFAGLDNEVRFGRQTSAETTGGLSVPDTHVSTLTRRIGPRGDATFNPGRWPGYADVKARLQAARRVDYARFRESRPQLLDEIPFEPVSSLTDLDQLDRAARQVMEFTAAPPPLSLADAPAAPLLPQLSLGDMFGVDAQILPGLSFAELFREVGVTGADAPADVATPPASPLSWKLRVTGLDWLFQLIGSAAGQLSIAQLFQMAAQQGQQIDTSTPVSFGIEATLDWSNDIFTDREFGPVTFKKRDESSALGKTEILINARARIDLGLEGFAEGDSQLAIEPAKLRMSSSAKLRNFSIIVFGAIEIIFSEVAFTVSEDGRKAFTTMIADVQLHDPLDFINQLSQMLGGLGKDFGVDIDISPARVRISQTVRFPPEEGAPLFLGPARITNLALGWGVMIPLLGRDVLTATFAISSREKPLTIFVPPWYGGKAHVLVEATTRGIRLLEISMEYGALIPVDWGIATGEGSLMAGILFMIEQTTLPDNTPSGKVLLKAFVKAEVNLSVAGIIHFCGLVYIALAYTQDNTGTYVVGEARVSVSIKIGLVRFSYSFSATHVEKSGGANAAPQLLASRSLHALQAGTFEPTIPPGSPEDVHLFGPAFNARRHAAFERIVAGYL